MNCWICGDKATTKEHIVKRTVIDQKMRDYAEHKLKTFITWQNNPGFSKHIQSAKSSRLQYPDYNLCRHCNSTLTQPFDLAFDKFLEYFQKNQKEFISNKAINFKKYFTKIELQNLFRYFMKTFGCIIDSTKSDPNNPKLLVPKEIIDAMNGKSYNKSLVLFFLIDDVEQYNTPERKVGFVRTNLYETDFNMIFFLESYDSLSIVYAYSDLKSKKELKVLAKRLKNPWFGKTKKIFFQGT